MSTSSGKKYQAGLTLQFHHMDFVRFAQLIDCRGQPGGCLPFLLRQER
jgi:hypothetical protein